MKIIQLSQLFHFATTVLAFLALTTMPSLAETLTGTVWQPADPRKPADDTAVVKVKTADRKTVLQSDNASKDGTYRFEIEKGLSVVVEAAWDSSRSSPGEAQTQVIRNPTKQDVQLLPPAPAPVQEWIRAGRASGLLGASAVTGLPASLKARGFPAAAIYGFIRGVQETAPASFPKVSETALFLKGEKIKLAEVVEAADTKFKATGVLPTFEELKVKSGGTLTAQEHFEILGFIAPRTDRAEIRKWNIAVEQSLGLALKPNVAEKQAAFDNQIFVVSPF